MEQVTKNNLVEVQPQRPKSLLQKTSAPAKSLADPRPEPGEAKQLWRGDQLYLALNMLPTMVIVFKRQ